VIDRRLLRILAVATVAIAGAFGLRAWLEQRKIEEAAEAGQAALARDTYGGFRDCDLALREVVAPGSPETSLVLVRAYALAELAAHYGDDQAGVESKLLLGPVEIRLSNGGLSLSAGDLSRLYASQALVALGDRAPGDALLAVGKVSEEQSSAELLAVRAEADLIDERSDLAKAALDAALGKDPGLLEGLRLQAEAALAAHRPEEAAVIYRRALAVNPRHVPSLVALAELASTIPGFDRLATADSLNDLSNLLSAEGSPDEQCRALLALAQLDLEVGHALAAPGLLEQAGQLEDAPLACELELAGLDRQLGREAAGHEQLERAAKSEAPGEAPLALAEAEVDPHAALELARQATPPELGIAKRYVWEARAAAVAVRANLALGQRKAAAALSGALQIDSWQARLGVARLRSAEGRPAEAAAALADAVKLARAAPRPGESLAEVGEAALSLQAFVTAQQACDAAAAATAGNCRAWLCSARALHSLARDGEARKRLDQAFLVNPAAPGVEALAGELRPSMAGSAQ
jgi:hypothetical protein